MCRVTNKGCVGFRVESLEVEPHAVEGAGLILADADLGTLR